MRATEFLIEYKQDKTIEIFGRKLVNALLNDNGNMPAPALDRQITLLLSPDMKGIELDQQTISHIANLILEFLKNADPTPHKQYTTWLAKVYSNQGIKLEDIISKGADWLAMYHELKLHKLLPPELNDINRLTFQQLYNIISDPELGGALTTAKNSALPKGKSEVILNTASVRIIHPLDINAAKYYGQGTTWCTAATNYNMFNKYNKEGPLFILLPKQPKYDGEKYQFHPASGQCMDEQDHPVNAKFVLASRFGDLLPLFRELDSGLDNMVIFANDDLLKELTLKIKDLAMEPIMERLSDWEANDDGYFSYLKSEGYINDEGDIDYENAPDYLEYNDAARDEFNMIEGAVNPSPRELQKAASEYQMEQGEPAVLSDLEEVLAFSMTYDRSRRETEFLQPIADWISLNIRIIPPVKHGTYADPTWRVKKAKWYLR